MLISNKSNWDFRKHLPKFEKRNQTQYNVKTLLSELIGQLFDSNGLRFHVGSWFCFNGEL